MVRQLKSIGCGVLYGLLISIQAGYAQLSGLSGEGGGVSFAGADGTHRRDTDQGGYGARALSAEGSVERDYRIPLLQADVVVSMSIFRATLDGRCKSFWGSRLLGAAEAF